MSLQSLVLDQECLLFWIIKPALLPASMLGDYSTSASSMPSNFFYVASTSGKPTSYRSALDLATLGTRLQGRLLSWLLILLFWTDVHAIRPVDGFKTSS